LSTANGSATAPIFWAAPDLAKAGYPVFPVKDKAPSVEGGFYAATTDVSQVAEWITEGREHHDVAFATGIVSGVVVLDADTPEATVSLPCGLLAAGTGIFVTPATGRCRAPQSQMASTAKVTAVTSLPLRAGAGHGLMGCPCPRTYPSYRRSSGPSRRSRRIADARRRRRSTAEPWKPSLGTSQE
jgi:hypothetical protein